MSNLPAASTCYHCGLPLAGTRRAASPAPQAVDAEAVEPEFCCFGCRLASEITAGRLEQGERRWTLVRLGLAIFLSLNVMMFTMVLWTHDVYAPSTDPSARAWDDLLRHLLLVLSLPVMWLLGEPLLRGAWQSLRHGRPGTDLLIALGVIAAMAHSIWSVRRGSGSTYFEVACTVLVMVTLGRWLEANAKSKAHELLDGLSRLLPDSVCRLLDHAAGPAGRSEQVPLHQVRPGDWLRVSAGQRIPVDGLVEQGQALVDQQLLSGESLPVPKVPHDAVIGGTLNLDGDLVIRVEALPGEGALGRLRAAMEAARARQGRYEQLADRAAAWFTPAMLLVALATFLYHGFFDSWDHGTLAALAVVLIACPCALGLATPLAVWVALEAAARRQVLIQGGQAIERLAAVREVAFDKTGTLSTGQAQLHAVYFDEQLPREPVIARALALAGGSQHPLCRALVEGQLWAQAQVRPVQSGGLATQCGTSSATTPAGQHPIWDVIRTEAGCGVAARFDGESSRSGLGRWEWLASMGLAASPQLTAAWQQAQSAGRPLAAIGWSDRMRGLFVFDEHLRPEAAEALDWCRQLGLSVQVLTGDHLGRGEALAKQLQVNVLSGLSPWDKQQWIERRRQQGHGVVMVGDGLNDAPALAAADVGMALGCGADLSRQAAAVCLAGNDLLRVPWSMALARLTVRTMRQNLLWAFVYNVAGVGLAAWGLLNPVWAAVAMLASSMMVLANSFWLSRRIEQWSIRHTGLPRTSDPGESSSRQMPEVLAAKLPPTFEDDSARDLPTVPLHPPVERRAEVAV